MEWNYKTKIYKQKTTKFLWKPHYCSDCKKGFWLMNVPYNINYSENIYNNVPQCPKCFKRIWEFK